MDLLNKWNAILKEHNNQDWDAFFKKMKEKVKKLELINYPSDYHNRQGARCKIKYIYDDETITVAYGDDHCLASMYNKNPDRKEQWKCKDRFKENWRIYPPGITYSPLRQTFKEAMAESRVIELLDSIEPEFRLGMVLLTYELVLKFASPVVRPFEDFKELGCIIL
jgi:hypothetical protein